MTLVQSAIIVALTVGCALRARHWSARRQSRPLTFALAALIVGQLGRVPGVNRALDAVPVLPDGLASIIGNAAQLAALAAIAIHALTALRLANRLTMLTNLAAAGFFGLAATYVLDTIGQFSAGFADDPLAFQWLILTGMDVTACSLMARACYVGLDGADAWQRAVLLSWLTAAVCGLTADAIRVYEVITPGVSAFGAGSVYAARMSSLLLAVGVILLELYREGNRTDGMGRTATKRALPRHVPRRRRSQAFRRNVFEEG
ncbi:membrane protein [Gordonia phage Catfish]|uniref:Membrane protein n=1 Tax=Gordonia phage Catfish TaxID=2301538 RepID=A0A385D1H6_9CAUD|nr:membrane protein [Gordonia phage Catfish]AXQ51874.1 membrane protein [Gordonia phage Catfish]